MKTKLLLLLFLFIIFSSTYKGNIINKTIHNDTLWHNKQLFLRQDFKEEKNKLSGYWAWGKDTLYFISDSFLFDSCPDKKVLNPIPIFYKKKSFNGSYQYSAFVCKEYLQLKVDIQKIEIDRQKGDTIFYIKHTCKLIDAILQHSDLPDSINIDIDNPISNDNELPAKNIVWEERYIIYSLKRGVIGYQKSKNNCECCWY